MGEKGRLGSGQGAAFSRRYGDIGLLDKEQEEVPKISVSKFCSPPVPNGVAVKTAFSAATHTGTRGPPSAQGTFCLPSHLIVSPSHPFPDPRP